MSYGLILFPEGRLADFAHIPAVETLGEFATRAANAFDRLADRALGTKQQDFSQVTQERRRSSQARQAERPLGGQAVDERKPRPDWPDTEFREEGSDFAPQFSNVEVFDEDAAGIAPRERQSKQAARQVIVLDAAHIAALVRERRSDGSVHGHALFEGVQRSGGERAVKAARSDVKMTRVRLDQADTAAKIRG